MVQIWFLKFIKRILGVILCYAFNNNVNFSLFIFLLLLYKDVRLFSLSNDEQFNFHLLDYSCSKKRKCDES